MPLGHCFMSESIRECQSFTQSIYLEMKQYCMLLEDVQPCWFCFDVICSTIIKFIFVPYDVVICIFLRNWPSIFKSYCPSLFFLIGIPWNTRQNFETFHSWVLFFSEQVLFSEHYVFAVQVRAVHSLLVTCFTTTAKAVC